jgi:hypothetical protein
MRWFGLYATHVSNGAPFRANTKTRCGSCMIVNMLPLMFLLKIETTFYDEWITHEFVRLLCTS